jgi:uncharacterized protein YdgA (DUF945 family)
MKKLMGLVIVLCGLVLGSYYGMGIVTENSLKKSIAIVNQSNGLYADIDHYDRGWFTSFSVLNWRLHVPERVNKDQNGQSIVVAAQDYKIQMPITIYHGPIIYAKSGLRFGLGYAESDLTMPPAFSDKFASLFTPASTKPTLALNLFVNYLNASSLHIRVPEFQIISKQGVDQLKWLGLDSDMNISSNMKNMYGGVHFDGAKWTSEKVVTTIGTMTSAYDMHRTDTGLYMGKATLSIPSIVAQENNQKLLAIEDLNLSTDSDVKDGLFGTHFNASVNRVFADGKPYGPANWEMSVTNLDAKVLADINEQSNRMQQGTDSERQQALLALLPDLPKLLSKGAQFEISKLSLVMPEGVVSGNLLVTMPEGEAGNPFQIVQKVKGNGMLKLPTSFVRRIVLTALKQKVMTQPTIQQAMIQQMKVDQDKSQPVSTGTAVDDIAKAAGNNSSTPDAVGGKESLSTQPSAPHTSEGVKAGTALADATVVDTSEKGASIMTVPQATISNPSPQSVQLSTEMAQGQEKPLSAADAERQAEGQVDAKLSEMVQSGLLTLQGSEYVIELKLLQGELTVNGKPFNSAMLAF